MRLFKRAESPREKIKSTVLRRLRNTGTNEVIRWGDNNITAVGNNMREAQKSLNHSDSAQALMYLEDARTCAVSILAAIQVLEERINQQI